MKNQDRGLRLVGLPSGLRERPIQLEGPEDETDRDPAGKTPVRPEEDDSGTGFPEMWESMFGQGG